MERDEEGKYKIWRVVEKRERDAKMFMFAC